MPQIEKSPPSQHAAPPGTGDKKVDVAAIKKVSEGMAGLSPQEKSQYVKGHIGDYKNAGALAVYIGEGYGYVLTDKLPEPKSKVTIYSNQFITHGTDDDKGGERLPVQAALAMLALDADSASIPIENVGTYVHEIIARKGEFNSVTEKFLPKGYGMLGTATEIFPGGYITARHVATADPTLRHTYGPNEIRMRIDKSAIKLDQVAFILSDRGPWFDASLFTLGGKNLYAKLNPGDSIPIMPFSELRPPPGMWLQFYYRPGEYPFVKIAPSSPKYTFVTETFNETFKDSRFETSAQILGGLSGAGIFDTDSYNRAIFMGVQRAGQGVPDRIFELGQKQDPNGPIFAGVERKYVGKTFTPSDDAKLGPSGSINSEFVSSIIGRQLIERLIYQYKRDQN